MKNLIVLFLLLICSTAHGQILKTANLNLNTGGVIHDVVYDSYSQCYIVVGNFISINGTPRTNIAFIKASDYSIAAFNPIISIDGEIRSVAIAKNTSYNYSYLYLGGDFSLVNGNVRNSMVRFRAITDGGAGLPYLLTPWTSGIELFGFTGPTNEKGVNSLEVYGDTLFAAGRFEIPYTNTPTGNEIRNICAYSAGLPNNSTLILPILDTTPLQLDDPNVRLFEVKKFGDYVYTVGGSFGGTNSQEIERLDMNGVVDQSFNISNCGTDYSIWDLDFYENTIDTFMYAKRQHTSTIATYVHASDGSIIQGANCNNLQYFSGSPLLNQGVEVYKSSLFGLDNFVLTRYDLSQPSPRSIQFSNTLNANWYGTNQSIGNNYAYHKINTARNNLFISGSNLTQVNGQSRVGLAIYCLEPQDAKPFTSFDLTACEGDSSIYTIPQTEFADGYRWTYSGTGAFYRIAGSGDALVGLSTHHLTGTNTNSIEIYFPIGTTNGTLTVEPFSVCNTTTDYQYSQGQSDVISINAVPDIILPLTHTLNCYADTIYVVAQSSMSNVDYSWTYNGLGVAIENDSVTVAQGLNLADSTFYVVTVDNPITGCFSIDSTYFTTDLIADPIVQSAITTNPLEWNCLTDSMTINSNIVGATVTWENPSLVGTFADPYVITSIPSGNLTVYATYLLNGCSAQADFGGIIESTLQADGMLVGYPLTGGLPIDTLSCDNSTLSIECDVTPAFSANSTAQWIVGGVPTGSDVLNLTQADAFGTNPLTFEFETINNDNGCTQSYNVAVSYNFNAPYVFSLADQSINCSQSEITLTHPTNGSSNIIEGWLDGASSQTGVDTIIAILGNYYYQVVDTDNGCVNTDTVSVTQTLDLIIAMPLDTLICPDEIVLITPTIIGNSETPSYLWSTGSTSATQNATGGIDSQLSVTVTTPSGCVGADTTTISITLPIDATITPIAGCTDGNLEVTSITGGAGNYQYSLDASTWQTSTTFGGLAFDDYTISVLDDLGCVYDFDQTLDGTASSVEMQFAVSTYNEEGDTIVLVNITDFTGLDSIGWGLPTNANVFYEEDSTVILSIATGGWYDVDLYGYLGSNCMYTYTTSVYFGTEAPVFDETYTSNGIQSFVVSPNPTTGQFDVDLEFGTAQNYSIIVTNSLGQPIAGMGVSAVGTIVNHSFQFPLGTPAGSYRIHVIADYDAQQKMIILN